MPKPFYLLLAFLLADVMLAPAQIAPTSPGRQRAANRQALREARHADAPYKDTHLAVTRQQLKRGSGATQLPTAGEPRFSRDGTPHVNEPKYPGMRRHRAKAEPRP